MLVPTQSYSELGRLSLSRMMESMWLNGNWKMGLHFFNAISNLTLSSLYTKLFLSQSAAPTKNTDGEG